MKSIYSDFRQYVLTASAFILFLNGCSVLMGSIKPVDQKAPRIPFTDVSKISPDWKPMAIQARKNAEDVPDAAWQSTKTAAVISINSACRQNPDEQLDTKEVTQMLLSQWDNLNILEEKDRVVSGLPAHDTEAEGKYLGRTRKFRTTVVKSPSCIYDLVLLSPVKSFPQELSVFEQFRDSLNLK